MLFSTLMTQNAQTKMGPSFVVDLSAQHCCEEGNELESFVSVPIFSLVPLSTRKQRQTSPQTQHSSPGLVAISAQLLCKLVTVGRNI